MLQTILTMFLDVLLTNVSEKKRNKQSMLLCPSKQKISMSMCQTRSMEGAAMAAKYCKLTGDFDNAIEFLIMQKR